MSADRLRVPAQLAPLRRVRLLFVVLGLVTLAGAVAVRVAGSDPTLLAAPWAVAGGAVLAGSWLLTWRRSAVALWQDPAEWLALAAVTLSAGPEHATGVVFGGLFLRALYLQAPRLGLSTAAGVAVWLGCAARLDGTAGLLTALPRAAVMVLTAAAMLLLARSLRLYERAVARERELVEEVERRRGEDRFRSLVRAASDLLLVVDAAGTVTFASPSARRILGRPPEALEGFPLASLAHPDDPGPLADGPLERLVASGAFEWLAAGRDGEPVELEALAQDLRDDPSVAGVVLTSRDIRERKAFERLLAHQAFHDGLTGLPNRARLLERLAATAHGSVAPTVLYLDLDDFKTVNDSLGHPAGDELLLRVAARLRGLAGPDDLAARLGGDEFVLLLAAAPDRAAAAATAARAIEVLGEPVVLDGMELRMGVSAGIAGGHKDPAELLRDADAALNAAKAAGKGRFAFFELSMQEAAIARLALRADLQRALEADELVVHYQPTYDLRSGHMTGVEALVRWQHPERGLVPPGLFVPLAEETGLVVPLGRHVLGVACRQVRAWQRAHPLQPRLRVSVNVSARQLLDPGLVDDVAEALASSGLEPDALVLEITETVLAQDTGLAVERLTALRALGTRIAVDDFGTGYSSLRYLQRFPLDVLKLDRSFVEDVDRGPRGSTFAQVIVDLGRALGLEVVAEGIERRAQLDVLRELGCDTGQGYLLARAMPAAAVAEHLPRRPTSALRPAAAE